VHVRKIAATAARIHLFRLPLMGLFAVLILLVTSSGPAQALPYDGQDPAQAGCAVGVTTVASASIVVSGVDVGLVELRKSPGCNTFWARTTSYQGVQYLRADVRRDDDQYGQIFPFGMTAGQVYGNMLSPVMGMCVRAQGAVAGYWTTTPPVCTA
jgi:hypothetical protein